MNKTTTTIIAGVIAGLVISAASFWAGNYYQGWQMRSRFSFGTPRGGAGGGMTGPGGMMGRGGQMPFSGNRGRGGGPAGERVITGRLDKFSDDQLTLTTRFGSVKVSVDSKTSVKWARAAKAADLKSGAQVIIEGGLDESGKLTAKSVIVTK